MAGAVDIRNGYFLEITPALTLIPHPQSKNLLVEVPTVSKPHSCSRRILVIAANNGLMFALQAIVKTVAVICV
jgi:hypothetical protein